MKNALIISVLVIGLVLQGFFAFPAAAQVAPPSYPAGYCPQLNYNLYRGLHDYQTAGQVSALQQFLAGQGFSQPITGYFGAITYRNTARFQSEHAIYPVTGGVGPLTRAAIAQICGGTPSYPSNSLSITGVAGPTTLGIGESGTWSVTTNAAVNSYLSVNVNWGDQQVYPYANAASQTVYQNNTFTHAYQAAGTYTITFTATDQYGHTSSASATVIVGGSAGCNYTSNCVGGLTITSPFAGETVALGSQLLISWGYPVTPGSATSVLSLYTEAGTDVGVIAVSNNTSGSYTWSVPPFPQTEMCTMIYPNGLCGTNLVPGQYYIQVKEVSGSGFDPNATVYATGQSGLFTITSGMSTQNTFSIYPTSGAAPLAVTWACMQLTSAMARAKAFFRAPSHIPTTFRELTQRPSRATSLACTPRLAAR